MGGLFVSFEGVEGSGKSTQLDRLARALAGRRPSPIVVHEPGGTPLGREIRDLLLDPAHAEMAPETELLLYAASRAQLVRAVIGPSLAEGHLVLTDRYTDSTIAYQSFGRGIPRDVVDAVNEVATGGLMPQLTVLLDVEAEIGLSRVGGEPDRIEREPPAFHERVRAGFLALADEEPDRFMVLDGTEAEDALAGQILERVSALL